ncbi:MAG: Uma2 family endonuclease [Gemmatimonadota bacterium]
MQTETLLLTIEEFERLPDDGMRMELVRGQVVREPPAGFEHGAIGIDLGAILRQFVKGLELGKVVGADTGFVLFDEPPTVRAPDVAFVARDRLTFDPRRFVPFAPDLAVEIVSPLSTVSEIHGKVMDYLDAGTRAVWVVDPGSRSVTVYRARDDVQWLTGDDDLDGRPVLPGFRLRLSELFPG